MERKTKPPCITAFKFFHYWLLFLPKTLINPPFFSPTDSMRWSKWRFVMLALACVFVIGEYYCHDNKTEIQEKIEQELEID